MPTLIKVIVNTDWKGRATHNLKKLGTGTTQELQNIQNADVELWHKDDLDAENELLREEAEEDGTDPHLCTVWANAERWEMARTEGDEFRMFCGKIEGDTWSLSYVVLDD